MKDGEFKDTVMSRKEAAKLKLESIFNAIKRYPLKYKVIGALLIFAFFWVWGLIAQFSAAIGTMEIQSMTPNPFYCFACIFTKGIGNSIIGLMVVLLFIGLFKLWYYRNHIDEPKTKTIYRSGKFMKVVIDDGTLATGHEATLSDLEEKYIVTATPWEFNQPIYGKNYDDGRYVLSQNVRAGTNRNSIAFGSGGSRKSRGYIIPMISQLAKNGENMVITDPSGELLAYTYYLLVKNGYEIKVINTRNPIQSNGWNFIGDIGTDFQLAQIFAQTIIENTGAKDAKKEQFWDDEMINLLTALIIYVNTKIPDEGNIKSVVNLISNKSAKDLEKLFETMPTHSPAKKSYNIFKNSGNLQEQILNNLGIRLKIFFEPKMAEMLSTNDIHISDLADKDKKSAYFIITNEQDHTYAMIAGLFLDASFKILSECAIKNTNSNLLPNPVNFIFDEFNNIGHIYDAGQKLSVSRKYNLIVHMIIQSYPQFIQRYTEEEVEEIIGNCNYVLMLRAGENSTAEYFSKLYGEMTVFTKQRTSSSPILNMTDTLRSTLQKRPIYNTDEVMHIGTENLLLWSADSYVVKLKKIDFTELKEFKELFQECGGEKNAEFHISKYEGTVFLPYDKAKRMDNINKSEKNNFVLDNNSISAKSFIEKQPQGVLQPQQRLEITRSSNINTEKPVSSNNSNRGIGLSPQMNVSRDVFGYSKQSKAGRKPLRVNNYPDAPTTQLTEKTSISNPNNTSYSSNDNISGLYKNDGTPKFFDISIFEDDDTEQQMTIEQYINENSLEQINSIPKVKMKVDWGPVLSQYKAFIKRDRDGKIRFHSNEFPRVKGEQVYLLFFKSNADFIRSKLPNTQLRCSGELLDISAITHMFLTNIDLPQQYYIDYWTKIINSSGKQERVDIGHIIQMPKSHITLIPHINKKTLAQNILKI